MDLLREHVDFRRLFIAQTISQIGSQISFLAIPLMAAVTLNATPAEMGLLTAMGSLPALVVGLHAGVFVDRHARRPVLISSDLARALLLGAIPVAWWLGLLSLPLLFGIAFLGGFGALLFDIAYQAYLPSLIDRKRLIEGNSGLELSRSAAEVAGPTIAGLLIQVLKAPLAIAADALSFVVSALLISRIETRESARTSSSATPSIWSQAHAGLRAVVRTPAVRALAVSAAGLGLFNAMIEAVWILYLVGSVGMEPGILGMVFAAGSVGFVVGALLPGPAVARFGVGPTLTISVAIIGLSDLALPLVGQDLIVVAFAVMLGQFCFGMGLTVFNVAQLSLRQALVAESMLGRVGGLMRVAGWGTAPIGALVGGVLGTLVGVRPTLLIAALLETAIAVWIWRSPLWAVKAISLVQDDD